MGKLKEKDKQYVYDAILESEDIQKLIIRIVNQNITTSRTELTDTKEENNLRLQISQLQSQLQRTNKSLAEYKNLYISAKPKIDDYDYQKNRVSELETESNKKQLQIDRLENTINGLQQENNKLSADLKSAEKTIDSFKKTFEKPAEYLEMYRSLSYSVRNGLENVINDKNEIMFIVSCSNEHNLSSVWEYLKGISNDYNSEDFRKLSQIFDYFFDVFNDSLPEPKYERDDVENGDDFDDDLYNRCFGSATSGDITKVILRGYRSENTGTTICKSVVKV